MLYCANCEWLVKAPQASCPLCGGAVREAKENDPVLLMELGAFHANIVSPLLDDAGFFYVKLGRHGVGFTMYGGNLLEAFRFYVPYGAFEKTVSLIRSVFGEDPVIMEALNKRHGEEDADG